MSLRDDLRMYYNGCYVSCVVNGDLRVLHVEDARTSSESTDDAELHGQLYRLTDRAPVHLGYDAVNFDDINPAMPLSGYYKFFDRTRPVYVEAQLQNRTTRKGFDPSRVLGDHGNFRLERTHFIQMFSPQAFEGRLRRDLIANSDNELHWRGNVIGTYREAEPTLFNQYTHMRTLVCKLLEQSFGGLRLN